MRLFRVRIETEIGWSEWSSSLRVEAGLLSGDDWVARPITLPDDPGSQHQAPSPILRREFDVDGTVAVARLHVTALGVHATAINGRSVTDDVLAPGWTPYGRRLNADTYDVTNLLVIGTNVIAAMIGDGWYRGRLGWNPEGDRCHYGLEIGLIAQLEIRLLDGREIMIAGRTRLDAGQNVAGWVRLTVRGARGASIVVRHAEVLESDGSLHTRSLRSAKATDTYTLADGEPTVIEPSFTFHGFRYAEVDTDAEIIDASVVAISSDTPRRGWFSCADPLLGRLHENTVWSQRDNFVSVPTDCPQRDERLGWTGDAQAFAPTASTLFDAESFGQAGSATSHWSRTRGLACRVSFPMSSSTASCGTGGRAGPMRRPSCRGLSMSRSAPSTSSGNSSQACGAGSTLWWHARAKTACCRARTSSEIGSTRTPRATDRGWPRPTRPT